MKKSIILIICAMMISGTVLARPKFAKEVGFKCADCHDNKKKKEPNPDNKNWATAKKHIDKLNDEKKSCVDCHNGQNKPAQ